MSDFRRVALGALFFLQAAFLYADESVLLKFKEGTPENTQRNLVSRSTPTAVSLMEEISVWRIRFSAEQDALNAVIFFQSFDETEYCHKSRRRRAFAPDDPRYIDNSQWGLNGTNGINMDQAWDIEGSSGSASIIIAVIDSGVDYNHEDFASKIWINAGEIPANGLDDDKNGYIDDYNGYDWVNNDNDPLDDNGHGTHVAGIAAAATNNSTGIAGVSINSRIMALKVLDSFGSGDEADEAEAILWAVRHGARVINLSLGADGYSHTEAEACSYAFERGVFIAAASGNDGTSYISYPAGLSSAFSVGASDSAGNKAAFSNYGPNLDVLAPGVDILSTVPDTNPGGAPNDPWDIWDASGYSSEPGTSMATPFVAGLASIVLSIRPDYGPGQVAEAIRRSGSDYPTFTNERGYGVINANDCIANLNAQLSLLTQKVTVYPNPLRTSAGTNLMFSFNPAPSVVNEVRIFDFSGQQVIRLGPGEYYAPSQTVPWDGKNSHGAKVATGIYFYFAETNIGQSKGHFAVIK